jgi:hypothetical protein
VVQHGVVIAFGDPPRGHHLDAETLQQDWQRPVRRGRRRFAERRVGRNGRLSHGRRPEPGEPPVRLGHVACGEDVGHPGAHRGVHQHTAPHRNSRGTRQVHLGCHARTQQGEVRRNAASVGHHDSTHAVGAVEGGRRGVGEDRDAATGQVSLQEPGTARVNVVAQ